MTKKVNFKLGENFMSRMYAIQIWQDVKPKKKITFSKVNLTEDCDENNGEEVMVNGDVDSKGDS